MKAVEDGWYTTSESGPMVRHVEERLDPEHPSTWVSSDEGKNYVLIADGAPVAVLFNGRGLVRADKLVLDAETMLECWIDLPAEWKGLYAPEGEEIPCALAPVQPSHKVYWQSADGHAAKTVVRVEGENAYGHVEHQFREHPRAKPNWQIINGQWYWRGNGGELYRTPANKIGTVRPVPL